MNCGLGDLQNIHMTHELSKKFGTTWLTTPPEDHFRSLTPIQIDAARNVFGDSLDFNSLLISDLVGMQNRPFAMMILLPCVPTWLNGALFSVLHLVHCGTFDPDSNILIHELTHIWQSQHHPDPNAVIFNSIQSQSLASANNLRNIDIHAPAADILQSPFSAYAYEPGKAFGDYAAEQIAQQVQHGAADICNHIRNAPKGKSDTENIRGLAVPQIEDRRKPRVKFL